MQALESDPALISFPASEGEAPTAKGNYEAVRFNAMKHGAGIRADKPCTARRTGELRIPKANYGPWRCWN